MSKQRIQLRPMILSVMILVSVFSPVMVQASHKKVSIIEKTGMVQVRRKTSNKFFDSFVNMNISEGDTIITGPDGDLAIIIDDKNTLTAGQSTAFSFTDLSSTAVKDNTHVKLIYGSVFHDVTEKQTGNKSYQVETSNTIMGVRGTQFAVNNILVDGKETTVVLALEGEVEVSAIPDTKLSPNDPSTAPISIKGGEMLQVVTTTNGTIIMAKGAVDFSSLNVDTLEWILTVEDVDSEMVAAARKQLPVAKEAEKLAAPAPVSVNNKPLTLKDVLADKEAYIDDKPADSEEDEDEDITPIPDKKPKYLSHAIDVSGRIITFTFDTDLDITSELDISDNDNQIITTVAGNIIEADFTGASNQLYTIGFSKVKSDTGKVSADTTIITFDLSQEDPPPGGSVINISDISDLKKLSVDYGIMPLGGEGNHVTINMKADITWDSVTYGDFTGFVIGNATFNGQGHAIKDLIVGPLAGQPEGGFIRLVTGQATIKNLVIDNGIGNFTEGVPTNGIGILIGRGEDITIDNITIKNSRLLAGESNAGAIIGHVSGGDIKLSNVNLEDITIENHVSTVTALGIAIGITQGERVIIDHLKIKNSTIHAGSQAGGVVGHLKNTDLTKLRDIEVKNLSITTENDYAGGLIGNGESQSYDMKDITIQKITVAGKNFIGGGFGKLSGTGQVADLTVKNPQISGESHVGGVAGLIDGQITLQNVTVENNSSSIPYNIIATGDHVGGIAGELTNNVTIENSQVDKIIISYSGSGNLGGVAGTVTNLIAKNLQVDDLVLESTQGDNIGGIFGVMTGSHLEKAEVDDLTLTANTGNNVAGMAGLVVDSQFSGKMVVEDSVISGTGANIGGFFGKLDGSANPVSMNSSFTGVVDHVTLPANSGFIMGRMVGNITGGNLPLQVKNNTQIGEVLATSSQYVQTDDRTDTTTVLFAINISN